MAGTMPLCKALFELEMRPSFPMHISSVPMLHSLAGPCSGGRIQDGYQRALDLKFHWELL